MATTDLLATTELDVNVTTQAPSGNLPLEVLRSIHVIAITCCTLSVIASTTVIVLSFTLKGHRVSITKKQLMDRLVIYLAIGDICFTFSHGLDHLVLYLNDETSVNSACQIFAFFFHWGLDTGCTIAAFVASSAFIAVVLGRKISWGTFDACLLCVSFGVTFLLSLLGVSLGWFNFNGIWCGVDPRVGTTTSSILTIVYEAFFPWITVVMGTICYSAIPIKLFLSNRRLKASGVEGDSGQLRRLATQFVVFIFILYLQWMALFVFFIFYFLFPKQLQVFHFKAAVSFTNLGGVYNALAYTLLRLRNRVSPQNEK